MGTSNSGTSWLHAFGNLQQAIDSAQAGDVILVAEGTYYPDVEFDADMSGGSDNREKTFYIDKNIEIKGGFSSTDTLTAANSASHATILDGNIGMMSDSTDNCYHVIYIDGTTPNGPITNSCVLDGFQIINGLANGATPINKRGGGLMNMAINGNSSPLIRYCDITNNGASRGGGLFNYGLSAGVSAPTIEYCLFQHNYATNDGAAIATETEMFGSSSAFLNYCNFVDNKAENCGGAIYLNSEDGTINDQITNCSFEMNQALTGDGGAIENISGNSGTCSPIFENCLFKGNIASEFGGVLNNVENSGTSAPTFTNCTLYGNIAGNLVFDAAIFGILTSNIAFNNSILWNNGDEITAPATLTNCLLNDGTPDNGSISYPSGVSNGGNNIDSDPLFVDVLSSNLRLQNTSPAINAGNDMAASTMTDLDSFDRKNGTIDMGAYENPFVNCPDHISIGTQYSPLVGDYQAHSLIDLSENALVKAGDAISLDAPVVILQPSVRFETGSEVQISQTGCP